jgi:hypothetical protein
MRNRRVQRFLAGAGRASRVQHRVLLSKLRRNGQSDFGEDYGLSTVRSVAEFRRRMPVTTYEDYRPYVERLKRGDTRALYGPGGRVLMFALTSGTTDRAKYIPITPEFLREYRTGWNLWGVRAYVDHMPMVRMKNLQLSSDWQQIHTEAGIPCGNISGLAADTAPLISRPVFILPRALMKISDTTSKQYTALRIAMASRRVGSIMTANPSTLVEFARLADAQRESLIRDIRDGTLSTRVAVPNVVRAKLHRSISRRNPERARELESIVAATGSLYPRDFWPKLQLMAVWTGGAVGAYLPRLKEFYGDVAVRDHGLSASEGRITIPLSDGTSAGILDYISHYFEFIPEEEHDDENPTILEAHELLPGRNYYVLLTTSSGFYRYDIHDLVRCVGYEGEAPILEFLNKGAHFASMTGEKLSEFQAVTAVKRAFEELGLDLEQFTVAPQWGDPPGYVLLIERGLDRANYAELTRRIDAYLARLNCEYANRLETRRLRPLEVYELPPGTWNAYRSAKIERLGGSLEQYKHPGLVGDMQFIDNLPRREPHWRFVTTGS